MPTTISHVRADGDYSLHETRTEGLWQLRVTIRHRRSDYPVAHADCIQQPDALHLSDIRVHQPAIEPPEPDGFRLRLPGRVLHIRSGAFSVQYVHPLDKVDFRRRGLGSILLQHLISAATAERIPSIRGVLSPVDYRPRPWLPDWYRSFGFLVPPGPYIGGAMIPIRRDML